MCIIWRYGGRWYGSESFPFPLEGACGDTPPRKKARWSYWKCCLCCISEMTLVPILINKTLFSANVFFFGNFNRGRCLGLPQCSYGAEFNVSQNSDIFELWIYFEIISYCFNVSNVILFMQLNFVNLNAPINRMLHNCKWIVINHVSIAGNLILSYLVRVPCNFNVNCFLLCNIQKG